MSNFSCTARSVSVRVKKEGRDISSEPRILDIAQCKMAITPISFFDVLDIFTDVKIAI